MTTMEASKYLTPDLAVEILARLLANPGWSGHPLPRQIDGLINYIVGVAKKDGYDLTNVAEYSNKVHCLAMYTIMRPMEV